MAAAKDFDPKRMVTNLLGPYHDFKLITDETYESLTTLTTLLLHSAFEHGRASGLSQAAEIAKPLHDKINSLR